MECGSDAAGPGGPSGANAGSAAIELCESSSVRKGHSHPSCHVRHYSHRPPILESFEDEDLI